jgi:hypothetical protein
MSSAACEITMTLAFLGFFLSFVPDFAAVELSLKMA